MKKFVFQLESLLRYRENQRDLCRQVLAQILAEQQRLRQSRLALEQQRTDLLDEMRQLGERGEVDIDRSAARRYYAGQMLGEIRAVDRNGEVVAEQLARCRQTLVQADRDVKALEKLREKRETEFQYEQQRREHRELDDIWHATHLTEVGRS